MLLVQILAAAVFVGLVVIAVLAFIEPGPLDRRSRDRQGRWPPNAAGPDDDNQRDTGHE